MIVGSTTMTTVQSDPAVPRGAAPGATTRVRREVGPLVRPYEVMVILDAGLEEDAIRSVIDRTTELIRSRGGDAPSVDRWGRRRFAYELKHRWEGYYVLIRADTEPSAMAELDRFLHLADEVLRHKVVRLPDKVAAAAAQAAAPVGSAEANGA
jgi:small subunit ribosomal protein S6